MLQFEALGDNCEFGLVQRRAGAEPLGLLRFAGFFIPAEQRLARLVEALNNGFAGLGELETLRVEAAGRVGQREYLVWEDAFNLMYHTFRSETEIESETLRGFEARKLAFLRRKFFNDLASGEKILVWKSNVRQSDADIDWLAERLRRFGPNTLLWVEQADKQHPSGTVEALGPGLLKGYVARFAPYDKATDICFESWVDVCAESHRLWRKPEPDGNVSQGQSIGPAFSTVRVLEQRSAMTPELAYRQGFAARRGGEPAGAQHDNLVLQDAWLAGWKAASPSPAAPPVEPAPADPVATVPHIVVTGSPTLPLAARLQHAFDRSVMGAGDLDEGVLAIPGMSGRKFRLFLNGLVKTVEDARYLETGVFQGATFCSAIRNNRVDATAIDNWSEYGGPANAFYRHLAEYWDRSSSVTVLNQDFRRVDYAHIGTFNIHLFDGPHQYQDQYDGARIVHDALDEVAIFIVDDWNWEQVRRGTYRGLADAGVRVDYSIEVRTTLDDSFPPVHSTRSDWHNGVFMGVIVKQSR